MLIYITVAVISFCAGVFFWIAMTGIKIATLRKYLGFKFEHNELEKKLMEENYCITRSLYMYEDFNADLIKKNTALQNKLDKIRDITYSSYKENEKV